MYTVDASVWVNAFDQREPGHTVSRQSLEVVRGQALPIIVPNLVLVEVAGAISRTRQAPEPAQAFALALRRLPHVTVRVLDEGVRSTPSRWRLSMACAAPMRSMQRSRTKRVARWLLWTTST